ncbi:uncharacterized protein LOC144914985 isoform X1 [Branchiostoma floridae x Branchiostoma belcheri]
MSDEESDTDDKSVVWVKPPEWRAPRLTHLVLLCQAVLDQNRKDRRLPFSSKERKSKSGDFTDRQPPAGRAAQDYTWDPAREDQGRDADEGAEDNGDDENNGVEGNEDIADGNGGNTDSNRGNDEDDDDDNE